MDELERPAKRHRSATRRQTKLAEKEQAQTPQGPTGAAEVCCAQHLAVSGPQGSFNSTSIAEGDQARDAVPLGSEPVCSPLPSRKQQGQCAATALR